ncbi:MAG: hypothetical protein MJK04_07770 [Psychrosphaera sp.]|nr:hypothetical protein [Psychrosphaera sp.]NQZ11270.1 hypothetical protein [Algicola sp.]
MKIKNMFTSLLLGLGLSMASNVSAYDPNMTQYQSCMLLCFYMDGNCANKADDKDCPRKYLRCKMGCGTP